MDREQIEEHWRDKGNWAWGIIYRCREDPRVIVPRRWRWGGWTLNFSHASAGRPIMRSSMQTVVNCYLNG